MSDQSDRQPELTCPSSLIVVSNRQPYRHDFEAEGRGVDENGADYEHFSDVLSTYEKLSATFPDGGVTGYQPDVSDDGGIDDDIPITVDEPAGGLTAGLDPVMQQEDGTWIAWGDGDADRIITDDDGCVSMPPGESAYTLKRLWFSQEAIDAYYYGFSNQVLWPLCHGFTQLIEDQSGYLEWYWSVNEQFADAVVEHADDTSVVWLQDYHLGFAPKIIQDHVPDSVTVAQFWHIPWPSPSVYRHCPAASELLEGMLGNDVLGFHVDTYADYFLDCADRFLPSVRVDRTARRIRYNGHETRIVTTPMGVDARRHDEIARSIDTSRWASIRESLDIPEETAIGLGVDRLDYTKGIPHRLSAIERFFDRYPHWQGAFTFVQKSTPSRTDIPAYDRHGSYVRGEVDRINDRFGTDEWQPVVYTEAMLPREDLCALYRYADVMLVSPLIDGMNLVAQEFIASNVDCSGALLLSDQTGAHEVLGEDAYTIHPTETDELAETIDRALTDSPSETNRRMTALRRHVFEKDLRRWMSRQFDHIAAVHGDREATENVSDSVSDTIEDNRYPSSQIGSR